MIFNKLTIEEERVIVHKGTEKPFSGEYDTFFEAGTYVCKRCGAELYRSESKFDAGCGWPAFDDEIEGAVERKPDPDGSRTEILCAACSGHLGHVFTGERFTAKNIRHCVNSLSMTFVPDQEKTGSIQTEEAIFAGGCFWGVEFYLQKVPGVVSTSVGYTGGFEPEPTYEEVCSNSTGHIEAVKVVFDKSKTSFEELAKLFFEIHDPTQVGRQGPDVGEQYSSVIFYKDDHQKKISEKLIAFLKNEGYKVATQLREAKEFWTAEDYHQQYYQKKGALPYCHTRTKRF